MKTHARSTLAFIFGFFVVAAFDLTAFAQPVVPDEQSDKERAAETLKLALENASEFDFYLGNDRQKKLTRYPRSVLRWSNPVATALSGEVFVLMPYPRA